MRKRKRRVRVQGVRRGRANVRIVSTQRSSAHRTRRQRYPYGSRREMGVGLRTKRPWIVEEGSEIEIFGPRPGSQRTEAPKRR